MEKPVNQQIDCDRYCPNARRRNKRRRRALKKTLEVFFDHHAPVCARRLHAQTEEAQRADEQNRERVANAELSGQRRYRVGKDLMEHDLVHTLTPRPGDTYVIHYRRIQCQRAR